MKIVGHFYVNINTHGYFYADGDEVAVPGSEALNRTVTELNVSSEMEFDADAHPFEKWPPTDKKVPFEWPSPIKSNYVENYLSSLKKPKRKIKLSVAGVLGGLLILYFLVVGFLYS